MEALVSPRLTKQIAVKLDDELMAQLRADAEANERSIGQTIRYLLRQQFAAERKEDA